MPPVNVTMGNREQVLAVEAMGGKLVSAELYPTSKGTHKFAIGQKLELFGMQDYPELDGTAVEITAYRDSDTENAYYIKSENPEVARWLNFVWEKRLRVPSAG